MASAAQIVVGIGAAMIALAFSLDAALLVPGVLVVAVGAVVHVVTPKSEKP